MFGAPLQGKRRQAPENSKDQPLMINKNERESPLRRDLAGGSIVCGSQSEKKGQNRSGISITTIVIELRENICQHQKKILQSSFIGMPGIAAAKPPKMGLMMWVSSPTPSPQRVQISL